MRDPDRRRILGAALVALQFGLLGLLAALAGPAFVRGQAGVGAWALVLWGAGIGLWTLTANRPGNFNIRPEPRSGARLVTGGPYRWIRHPMYTALLVAAAGLAWGGDNAHAAAAEGAGSAVSTGSSSSPWGVWAIWATWATWAALLVVLWAKSSLEERWLLARHAAYSHYRSRSWRFVPLLW